MLKNLLKSLAQQTLIPSQIIICDASNPINQLNFSDLTQYPFKIKYEISNIQSAAVQRNICLDKVDGGFKYLLVLDDDVEIPRNYCESIIGLLERTNACGVSGIAKKRGEINRQSWVTNIFKRIALLSSSKQGKILASGINVPVLSGTPFRIQEVEWLIGCSAWNLNCIGDIRYPSEFHGQSLFDDVIFSHRALKKGKLLVDNRIVLNHLLAEDSRPSTKEFYSMWIINRWFLINEMKNLKIKKWICFHWSNISKILFEVSYLLIDFNNHYQIILGILSGYKKLFLRNKKNAN